jgi:flavin reductase (DIM6/NTAB) family NADH-FMN oxidoreductase RutF
VQHRTSTPGRDAAAPQTAQPTPPSIDPKLFRKVMSSFASGVTVVTTVAGGQVRGMTVSAFMSGSLEPPLCVISVRKQARMHPVLIEAGHFGVTILARNQERISTHFAGAPVANLALEYIWIGRTPVLANATSVIAADIAHQYECGDHTLLAGHIRYLAAHSRPPLLVHRGRYASVSDAAEPPPDWAMDFW